MKYTVCKNIVYNTGGIKVDIATFITDTAHEMVGKT